MPHSRSTHLRARSLSIPLLGLALAVPGAAFAYDEKDAIRDCESRIGSEYGVSDLRDAHAERLTDTGHHYQVKGLAKVDGEKHPWTCEVKDRHVTAAEYRGPKPKGMSTAEKLAIGAAAAVATGVAASQIHEHTTERTAAPAEVTHTAAGSGTHGTSGSAHPSFNCAKATHEVEQIVCKDADLAKLDRDLASLYATVLRSTPASEHKTMQAEQRGWVKGRDDCWKASDKHACIEDEYQARIRELKDR